MDSTKGLTTSRALLFIMSATDGANPATVTACMIGLAIRMQEYSQTIALRTSLLLPNLSEIQSKKMRKHWYTIYVKQTARVKGQLYCFQFCIKSTCTYLKKKKKVIIINKILSLTKATLNKIFLIIIQCHDLGLCPPVWQYAPDPLTRPGFVSVRKVCMLFHTSKIWLWPKLLITLLKDIINLQHVERRISFGIGTLSFMK